MRILSFLFFGYLIAEIVSLVAAGRILGIGLTLLLLLAGVVVGALLVRGSFRSTLLNMRNGQTRMLSLLAGAQLRLLAGLLFIFPGFASDVIALLLLLPPIQTWAKGKAESSMPPPPSQPAKGPVIEGEAVEIVVEDNRLEHPKRPKD